MSTHSFLCRNTPDYFATIATAGQRDPLGQPRAGWSCCSGGRGPARSPVHRPTHKCVSCVSSLARFSRPGTNDGRGESLSVRQLHRFTEDSNTESDRGCTELEARLAANDCQARWTHRAGRLAGSPAVTKTTPAVGVAGAAGLGVRVRRYSDAVSAATDSDSEFGPNPESSGRESVCRTRSCTVTSPGPALQVEVQFPGSESAKIKKLRPDGIRDYM